MGRATSTLPPHVGGQRGNSRWGRGTYVRAGGPTCRWQRPTCNVHVSIRLRRHSPRRRVGDEMGCADRTPPSPCRCDSSHLVAPSHLPAAGCACLGGHSVRRSRGLSFNSEQAVFEMREHAPCTPCSSKNAFKSSRRSFGLRCRRERNVFFACNAPQCDLNEA